MLHNGINIIILGVLVKINAVMDLYSIIIPPSFPQGYCGFHFTIHDRFLLPANPGIGVLHHRGKYYAFYNKEAADGFASNPEG